MNRARLKEMAKIIAAGATPKAAYDATVKMSKRAIKRREKRVRQ